MTFSLMNLHLGCGKGGGLVGGCGARLWALDVLDLDLERRLREVLAHL